MKQWHFYEKVYRRWVVLMVGTFEEFKAELEFHEYKHMDTIIDSKGMCVPLNPENNKSGQYAYIVWLKKYETSTLVHEITHLVMMCFEEVAVPISFENTEGFAHYAEYWFTEMQKARRRFPDGKSPKEARR